MHSENFNCSDELVQIHSFFYPLVSRLSDQLIRATVLAELE